MIIGWPMLNGDATRGEREGNKLSRAQRMTGGIYEARKYKTRLDGDATDGTEWDQGDM